MHSKSEAVTVPSLMLMTSIVSEELLARDRQTDTCIHTPYLSLSDSRINTYITFFAHGQFLMKGKGGHVQYRVSKGTWGFNCLRWLFKKKVIYITLKCWELWIFHVFMCYIKTIYYYYYHHYHYLSGHDISHLHYNCQL